jgi:hypothetical protein
LYNDCISTGSLKEASLKDIQIYLILGVLAALLIVVVIGWLFARARRVGAADLPGMPVAQGDDEDVLYDPYGGEYPPATFSHKIEERVRAELAAEPGTSSYKVDFGTAADGSLQIRVDGKTYIEIKDIPDEPIRAAIARAIAAYQESNPPD